MVAVQTDLAAPKDVAAVGLYISSDGRPVFGDTRSVAPDGQVKLPATLAVLADASRPRAIIKIRAVAFKANGDVRVLRDVITTIPKGRTALLRTPLLWINEGSGSGNRGQLLASASLRPLDTSDGFSRLTSACPDGQTFIEGQCADAFVEGDALPDYSDKDVFGGGDSAGSGGRCFDVLGCFAGAEAVTLDSAACRATIPGIDPNDPNLSFAVALPASAETGECSGGRCLVPLDKGGGWRVDGPGIAFQGALCSRIATGRATGIVVSRACATKDLTIPSCGPASSVNVSAASGPGGVDGGSSSTEDFDEPIAVTGEPHLADLAVDADHLFVARAEANPPPAGVVRLKKSDVTSQKTPPELSVLFGYTAAGKQISSIALDPGSRAAHVVARGGAGELRLCTPTSSNDCTTFNIVGPSEVIASGPDEAYAFGGVASQIGLYAYPYDNPAPNLRPILPGTTMTALHYVDGALYIGTIDAAIYRCAAPCMTAGDVTPLRAAPAVPAIVTAIAAASGKIFFLQVPADGIDLRAGGVFELDAGGTAIEIGAGSEIGGTAGGGPPPTALAVDSEYVYWGGSFEDPRGGGRKNGVVRRNHRTRAPSAPLLEATQGTEPVTGLGVDGTHVFWTFDRADRSLLFARKKRAF